jgi:endonuclease/exonuclease/phosphatase family metal-dependent hydrolase
MKFRTSVLAAALAVVADAALDMRLITYNIRFAAEWRERGERPWGTRGPLMAAQLAHHTAGHPDALMCFQEALQHQIDDLVTLIDDGWEAVGQGRDGDHHGEHSPIFYRPEAWELLGDETYWLSPTPRKEGSRGWDAAFPRIVTVARLRHRKTGDPFVYMCTHFDHVGKVAREKSAEMIVRMADELAAVSHDGRHAPVFVAGDLNSEPHEGAFKTLAARLANSRDQVRDSRRIGNRNTYTAFTETNWDDMEIDFIFSRDPKDVEWVSFAVPNARFDDKVFISDHRPVIVDFKTK